MVHIQSGHQPNRPLGHSHKAIDKEQNEHCDDRKRIETEAVLKVEKVQIMDAGELVDVFLSAAECHHPLLERSFHGLLRLCVHALM